eukprot:gene8489-8671_t
MYGNKPSQLDAIPDLSATGFAPGIIAGFNLFYKEPCLTGIQTTYSSTPRPSWLLGIKEGSTELKIPLSSSEAITRVDLEYDERCIRFLSLHSNASVVRSVGVSNATGSNMAATAEPPNKEWQLVAVKGTSSRGK